MKPELEVSSQTTTLHILTLLKDVLYLFPRDDIKVNLITIQFTIMMYEK